MRVIYMELKKLAVCNSYTNVNDIITYSVHIRLYFVLSDFKSLFYVVTIMIWLNAQHHTLIIASTRWVQ